MSYLVNAVPAAFIPENGGRFTFRPLDPDQARVLFLTGHWGSPMTSSVGHADTAALISSILGVEVEAQRVSAPAPIPGGPAYLDRLTTRAQVQLCRNDDVLDAATPHDDPLSGADRALDCVVVAV